MCNWREKNVLRIFSKYLWIFASERRIEVCWAHRASFHNRGAEFQLTSLQCSLIFLVNRKKSKSCLIVNPKTSLESLVLSQEILISLLENPRKYTSELYSELTSLQCPCHLPLSHNKTKKYSVTCFKLKQTSFQCPLILLIVTVNIKRYSSWFFLWKS